MKTQEKCMPFSFEKTYIENLLIVRPRVFTDERGWFRENYKRSEFAANGIVEFFLQDNISFSSKGTLRGLHFQTGSAAQGKLVTVVHGSAWDVAVDLRKGSQTWGKWFGIELSAKNQLCFYVPPGFAHGFVSLEDHTLFQYKCTAEFDKASEGGLRWNDPTLAIDWPSTEVQVSEKDAILPFLDSSLLL